MADKFKLLFLGLLVVVLVGIALAVTRNHGWLALAIFVAGTYVLLRIRQRWSGASPRS